MNNTFVRTPLKRNIDTLYRPQSKPIEKAAWFIGFWANFLLILSIFLLILALSSKISFWVPEEPKREFLSSGSIPAPTIVKNKEIIWTQKMENERVSKLRANKKISSNTKKQVLNESISANKTNKYNVYALANAVALAETGNCKVWFGKEYNNCFGIKNGNTAPCDRVGRLNMCIYDEPKESYEAFVKIWSTHYQKMPTLKMAEAWTGKDNAKTWLKNVWHHYNKNA